FFFQAEDGIRDGHVTGVQTCALPICLRCEPLWILLQRHPRATVSQNKICDEDSNPRKHGSAVARSCRYGASSRRLGNLRRPPIGGSDHVCDCCGGHASTRPQWPWFLG